MINIIYEDKDIAIIDKPAGMVVHPSPGHHSNTLVNALLFHIKDLSSINGVIRPGIVHRIDKDTTGILIVCKNEEKNRSFIHSFSRFSENSQIKEQLCAVIFSEQAVFSG